MTNQTNRPDETQDAELDVALRKIARETHPRPAFVAKLRGELETQAAHPRRDFWSMLRGARPWLTQAVLITALVALVLIGGTMTSRLFAPDRGEFREIGANLTPSAGENVSLPANALARLGKGKIQSLDTAPDGRIAVGSTAGLCVYNTGLTPDWCRWTDSPVHAVLFDPSGTRLAVRYGTKSEVEIWDAAQGQVIASREFAIPVSYTSPNLPNPNFFIVNGLAWEPEGSRIAVIEVGQGVSAWDWQNDAIAWGPVAVGGELVGVEWLTGPEGESMVAALTPESLTLVDGNTGQAMTTLSDLVGAAPGTFLTLGRAAQGSRIAVGSDEKISVFELAAWNVTVYQSIPHPAGRFQNIALSADGTQLAAQTDQTVSQIITFDLRTGQQTANIPSMPSSPMAWSTANNRLYYASTEGSLAYFDGNFSNSIASGHTLAPQWVAWREEGTVVTAADRFIYTWDTSTQALASFGEMNPSGSAYAAGLSKDGTRALFFDPSASDSVNAARMIVWDVMNNQPLHDIEVGGFVHAVTLSPDGTRLGAVHESGQIFTWTLLDNGAEQRDMTGISGFTSVEALAFHPGGETLAIAYTHEIRGSTLEVWDIASQSMLYRLAPAGREWFDSPITSLAWSEDALFLGATSGQHVWLWDATTMQPVVIASQPDGDSVYALAALQFHPTNRETLATAHNGVFSIAPGGLAQFKGHELRVNDLAFRPDGKVLASASNDGTVILWDLGSGSLPTVEIRPTATPINLQEYTVVAGDTCGGIAYTFGISVESLISLNNLSADCSDLAVGQVLRIPYPTPTPDPTRPADYPEPPPSKPTASVLEYKVVDGDTCGGIAYNFGISVESLLTANNLAADCSNLTVDQILIIPYPTPTPLPLPTNTLESYPVPALGSPSPTPTRTTMPGQPTPLPNATKHSMPDTTGYDVTQTDGISASGKWRWIAIRGEWKPGAPREEDVNVIIAASTDGAQTWVLEEWTPHGLGEGRPTGFTFSADDRYLYFYDSGTPDGCGLPWQAVLRRLDLQSGIINHVPPTMHLNGYDEYALSPDASQLAVVTHSGIQIYGMDVLQPQQVILLPFIDSIEWTMTDIRWQPINNSTLMAFEIVSPPEDPCNTPPADQKRWTVVIDTKSVSAWNYLNPPGYVLHTWSDEREGGINGRLIYQSQDSSELQVDPRTGEVLP